METAMPARHPPAMAFLADAINPTNTAAILERCTLWPWVITLDYEVEDASCVNYPFRPERVIRMVQSTLAEMPNAEDLLPAGAHLLRCDVFPASRFDDMAPAVRERYREQHRAFLMWRKARAADKSPADLKPWVDYDPIAIDETVERWVRPVGRYAGD